MSPTSVALPAGAATRSPSCLGCLTPLIMRPVRRFHDRARRYGFTVAAGQVSRRHHIQVIGPASNAQGHQDRREKRQRVPASFQRVLTAANMLAAITAPLQRGSSGAWTPEQHMNEEDRSLFYQTLETLI